jgi:alpha-L-fucosidase
MQQLYDWKGYAQIVRELQPNAVIFQGGDLRWVGNEAGKGRESEWSVVPDNFNPQDKDIGGRDKLMLAAKDSRTLSWVPAEVDTSIRPGWFYHQREDLMVKSLPHLLNIYFDSVGNNGVLLLNLPPDRRGLLHENDVAILLELGKALDQIFAKDLARNAKASASAVRGNDSQYSADKTVDNNPETYWMTDDGVTQAEIVFDLGAPKTFNVAMLQEYIKQGQRVEEFYLESWDGKDWKPVAHSTTIGYKRLLRFEDVTAQKVRVRITQSRACPTLSNFSLYFAPEAGTGKKSIFK